MKYIAISLCVLLNASAAYCKESEKNYEQVALSKPTSDSYVDSIRSELRRGWLPPRGSESKNVVVRFSVDNRSQVSNVSVVKSSGISTMDEKAVKSIQPAVFRCSRIGGPMSNPSDVELTFDYPNPPTPEQRAQTEKVLKTAAELKAKKDVAGAEKVLNEAIEKDPENELLLSALRDLVPAQGNWGKKRKMWLMMQQARPQ